MDKTIEELRAELTKAKALAWAWVLAWVLAWAGAEVWAEARAGALADPWVLALAGVLAFAFAFAWAWALYKIRHIKSLIEQLEQDHELERLEDELAEAWAMSEGWGNAER